MNQPLPLILYALRLEITYNVLPMYLGRNADSQD